MTKILFVCLGNICRSPMAEAIMNDLVKNKKNIEVFSAGTAGYHNGENAHYATLEKLNQYGIDGSYLISSQLKENDYKHHDYIIAMDESNIKNIIKIFRKNSTKEQIEKSGVIIRKLLQQDVPDPWYTGDFEETYQLCLKGCQTLLKEIENKDK